MKQILIVLAFFILVNGNAVAQQTCPGVTVTATHCPFGPLACDLVHFTINNWSPTNNITSVELQLSGGIPVCNSTNPQPNTCGFFTTLSGTEYQWCPANPGNVSAQFRMLINYTSAVGTASCITPVFLIGNYNPRMDTFTIHRSLVTAPYASFTYATHRLLFNPGDPVVINVQHNFGWTIPQTTGNYNVKVIQVNQTGSVIPGGYNHEVIRYIDNNIAPGSEGLIQLMPAVSPMPGNPFHDFGAALPALPNAAAQLFFRVELWYCGNLKKSYIFEYSNRAPSTKVPADRVVSPK